ncbi:MAG TPA: NAD(P)/FAD-dependent oxidoreductase [Candidatus Polarisedimenticolia bacterium]|nr:NAD(P)/FAD-dependent oxidoreductase [Candidatus Polarisedimenticolia bacterium]
MAQNNRKIVVIGAGIAGLCAAVYARKCGYEVELVEQHESAGGLATSWRRGDYTFETCLHWLLGSGPKGMLHAQWQEVFDIGKLKFVDPEVYVRLETEHGESLSIYSNVDRMEAELLKVAPQDDVEIRRFASAVRRVSKFKMLAPDESWARKWLTSLRALPCLPLLRKLSSVTIEEYGRRFTHPLLKSFFEGGESARLSAVTLILSLAWMSEHNAGYPIGGSQAVIGLIVEKLRELGGHFRFGARVARVRVERDAAVGVQLADGEAIAADWVISAADGHSTIYELLGGKYADEITEKTYATLESFPSYLQVSLGIARDLSQQAGYVTRVLDAPLIVDPGTQLRQVSFRFFHYDPTFAPPGKTAVTCFLPTRNYEFWVNLQHRDPQRYQAEKHRICGEVIAILERSVPDVRQAIEVMDVSTPATVIRYTGNWKGSMEGWLLTPKSAFRPLRNTLPSLSQFLMVGQWVMPGGGLPSGLMTARSAIQAVCKQDRAPFTPQR